MMLLVLSLVRKCDGKAQVKHQEGKPHTLPDQELRTKCRKMVKNKSAQNWFQSGRPDRARLPDSVAANGSENGLSMRKLCQKEELPITLEF